MMWFRYNNDRVYINLFHLLPLYEVNLIWQVFHYMSMQSGNRMTLSWLTVGSLLLSTLYLLPCYCVLCVIHKMWGLYSYNSSIYSLACLLVVRVWEQYIAECCSFCLKWIVCHLLIVAGRRQIGNKEEGKGFLNCWYGIIVAVCALYNYVNIFLLFI